MLRGVVHDPTARRMGGVAGHAGLFSTADDLAKFAQVLLNGGGGILSAVTVEKMTSPEQPPQAPVLRGFGWDIDSPFSSNRGDLLPVGSFGHTGFTGTSVWHTVTARGRRPAGRQHATDYRSRLTVWEAAESREVVLAQKGVSTDAHRGDIERARNVPRAMVEQRIGPRRTEQAVAVTPGGRRVARVEAVGRDPSLDHRTGRSELAAERPYEPLQQHPGLRLSRRPP